MYKMLRIDRNKNNGLVWSKGNLIKRLLKYDITDRK